MLRECLEIFEQELERVARATGDADKLILDNYIPADGIYIIVKADDTIMWSEIKLNKKTGELDVTSRNMLEQIRKYDYNSQLVSMDKPQDPKKVIHSNNYLSFWVKQESLSNGKLDEQAIERYFDVLEKPKEKYKKPKDREMYEYIESQVGEIDLEKLEHHRQWIKEHIFNIDEMGVPLSGKNYLKIFFEDTDELYKSEGKRYTVAKIYNKNDYNVTRNGKILGLPNDNMGMNAKKPYTENKTRKVTVPYLLGSEEVFLQKKFFDYLMNMASAGKTKIFFSTETKEIIACTRAEMIPKDFTGYFLQIQKEKEVIIHHQDVIVDYRYFLKEKFKYVNILEVSEPEGLYKEYATKEQMQALIDEVIFSKWLIANYFTKIEELQLNGELKRTLARSRDAIFAWLYKGHDEQIAKILYQACLNMTLASIMGAYIGKAKKQFNLLYSFELYFKGGDSMGKTYGEVKNILREKINQKDTKSIETDEEYYYAVGQLVNYFISLNKAKDKKHSLANPFFNAKSNKVIDTKLRQFFMKYNYDLKYVGRKFNNLYAMVSDYQTTGEVNQKAVIAGYLNSNLMYESKKEETENE